MTEYEKSMLKAMGIVLDLLLLIVKIVGRNYISTFENVIEGLIYDADMKVKEWKKNETTQ